MFSFDEIPDREVAAAGEAARNCVLALQNLCNHLTYTDGFRRQHPEYPPSAFAGLCEVGEDNVRRLAERCRDLRAAVAQIGFDLCRALEREKMVGGKKCNSVHHGILDKAESLLVGVMIKSGWTGVVDWREPALELPVGQAAIRRQWLMISEAMSQDDFIQGVQDFVVDALPAIVDEAVAAADKRSSASGPTSKYARQLDAFKNAKTQRPDLTVAQFCKEYNRNIRNPDAKLEVRAFGAAVNRQNSVTPARARKKAGK